MLRWRPVRTHAIAIAGACVLASAPARAEPTAAELQAQGERLAKAGRYSEAIDAFKAADRREVRASHACLIALAYTRRELWPQAEIFMQACHERARPSDPEPEWVPQAEALIEERLRSANAALVELSTDPARPDVELSVSSFAPDETFGPRAIHLPLGRHAVLARAPGFEDERTEIQVADRSARRVVIKMWRVGKRPRPPSPPSHLDRYLMYGGLGASVAGAAVHLLWYRDNRAELDRARRDKDLVAYRDAEPAYDASRWLTLGLYAAGGAAVIAGSYLHHRRRERRAEAAVTVLPLPEGGGVVSVGWAR